MYLVDVEQERYALELRDRQLAQPDVVEERECSNPHALRVELCGLGDDLLALAAIPDRGPGGSRWLVFTSCASGPGWSGVGITSSGRATAISWAGRSVRPWVSRA